MDEEIKKTYNTVFDLIKNGYLNGCDPELAGILIRHKDEKERDFFMHLTYNLAKKYSQGEMDWDVFMEHTSSVYEKTGEKIRHKDEKERDFFMHLTYNLAKKYSQGEMDWDVFMEHTSSVYEKTGENPMYFELMNYFARRFERIERTEGK